MRFLAMDQMAFPYPSHRLSLMPSPCLSNTRLPLRLTNRILPVPTERVITWGLIIIGCFAFLLIIMLTW